MKKTILCVMATIMSLTFIPIQSGAATLEPSASLVVPKPEPSAEVKVLELRLNKINLMDKSKLKSSEKKELRNEVKSIKYKLREVGGGVYISAGALILIIILLIILL
jgi:hypothetical protein